MRDPEGELPPGEAPKRDRTSRGAAVIELFEDEPGPFGIDELHGGFPPDEPTVVLEESHGKADVARDPLVPAAHAVDEEQEFDRNAQRSQPPREPRRGTAAEALAVDHPAGPPPLLGRERSVTVCVERSPDELGGDVQATVLE
ncbi:MAG TPA: hypothetical protein VEY33_03560, partial [Gemmatimonadota bacterium]|nr:hypothetical protein [Gemmatimonadota bacterium]